MSLNLSSDGKVWHSLYKRGGVGRLHIVDRPEPAKKSPHLSFRLALLPFSMAPNGHDLLLAFTSPRYPVDVYSYDTQQGSWIAGPLVRRVESTPRVSRKRNSFVGRASMEERFPFSYTDRRKFKGKRQ